MNNFPIFVKEIPKLKIALPLTHYCRSTKVLETFTEGFLEIDDRSQITFCSKEMAELFDAKPCKLIGVNFWQLATDILALNWLVSHKQKVVPRQTLTFNNFFPDITRSLNVRFIVNDGGASIFLKGTSQEYKLNAFDSEKLELQKLFDLNSVPQWIYECDTLQFLNVNHAAAEQYGYSREEFLNMTLRKVHPEIEQKNFSQLEHKLEENSPHQTIVNHLYKNGELRKVRIDVRSIVYKGKNAQLETAIDYTAHFNAEKALAENEHRFKALVQNGSDLITILDDKWIYKYVNDSSKTILKLNPSELVGKSAFDLMHPDDRERVKDELETLDVKKILKLTPFRYADGDKNYRWIETIVTDMRGESSICGFVTNSRDITENLLNRISTQKSIERYDIVSKATSDTIWDWDLSTDRITWNRGIKGIFGHQHVEDTTAWFLSHVHPDDVEQAVIEKYRNALAEGKSRLTREYRFQCADGTYKNVLDRSFVIFDSFNQPTRVIGSMQDVTDKIEHITAIEQQNKKLQEISWLQSHAVRAPLASILGLTQLIPDHKLSKHDLRQLLTYIDSSAKELDEVIANIINTAKA